MITDNAVKATPSAHIQEIFARRNCAFVEEGVWPTPPPVFRADDVDPPEVLVRRRIWFKVPDGYMVWPPDLAPTGDEP